MWNGMDLLREHKTFEKVESRWMKEGTAHIEALERVSCFTLRHEAVKM